MPKQVVATAHTYINWLDGTFRTGQIPLVTGRPYTILNANNPNLATLESSYAASSFRTRNISELGGANYNNYTSLSLAIGYTLETNPTVKADLAAMAISRLDATVDIQLGYIDAYIGGNDGAMATGWPNFGVGYNSWLYSYIYFTEIAFCFDHLYSELTEAQRTKWTKFGMQALYNCYNPTTGTWHGGTEGSPTSRALIGNNTWAINPPNPTSNYHHHLTLGLLSMALAFEGEPVVTLNMQGTNVDLNGDYFFDLYNTVHMPRMVEQFGKLGSNGGGHMEGANYGLFSSDLYLIRNIHLWSKGTNFFPAEVEDWMEKTIGWTFHQALPNKTNVVTSGAHPNNEVAQIVAGYPKQLNYGMAAFPNAALAPAMKRLSTEIRPMINSSSNYLDEVYQFIGQPAIDGIVTAANYDAVPHVYAGEKAGDIYLHNNFDSDAVVVHIRSGEIHGGSHSQCDATALQVYKNGHLFVNTNVNYSNGDLHNSQAGALPSLDRNDRRHLSLVGVGNMHDWYPTAENTSLELTDYNPDVLFASDNVATDNEMYVSVDGAKAYHSLYPQMQQLNRQVSFLAEGVLVIFDSILTDSAEDVTIQYTSIYPPTLDGSSFVVDNGVSSAEVTLLSHAATWASAQKTLFVNGSGQSINRLGDGSYDCKAVIGNAASTVIVSVINIDSASTNAVLDSGTPGEHTVTVTLTGGGTKTITFYESLAERSIT